MTYINKQANEAERMIAAYDSYVFSAIGKTVANFDDVASVMAFNAAEACKEASKAYPVGSVDRNYWTNQAKDMACFIY